MNLMNSRYSNVLIIRVSREQLQAHAMEDVCACWYYDLADTIHETTDNDLIRIIQREPCFACE
jgi:hypothetical protein